MKVLVINSGSTTQKMSLMLISNSENGELSTFKVWDKSSPVEPDGDRAAVIKTQLEEMASDQEENSVSVDAVGHRIVHGGHQFQESTLVNDKVVESIRQISDLAPIHNPPALESIECTLKLFPKIPQIAIFDTAFHSKMPPENYRYAVPEDWYKNHGIRKFGFHGISHQYCWSKAMQLTQHKEAYKLISCHLGGGSSIAAIVDGISVDTTMGFTPLDGLMMSTRSGAIDPGIIPYIAKSAKLDFNDIDHILNKESGIKGISSTSGDMRKTIEEADKGTANAQLALEMFLASLKKNISSMIASMEGVDIIAFTGGIGENSELIRERTCQSLHYLGINIDVGLNKSSGDRIISMEDSAIEVAVVYSDESKEIAKECYELVNH